MVMMVMMVMMMMVMMVVMMMMVMMMVMMVMMMVMMMISGRNSLFSVGGGAKPPKFPTKLSNFRQTPHLHSFRSKFKFPKIRQFSVKVGATPPPAPPRFPPQMMMVMMMIMMDVMMMVLQTYIPA
jgi:hypothetical protein